MHAFPFTSLLVPVVLVTKGRGREVFSCSRALFARLEELPRLKETILQIDYGVRTLSPDSIAALETMIWLCGFECFKTASRRQSRPFNRFGTKWSWKFLSEYLGFEWREKGPSAR